MKQRVYIVGAILWKYQLLYYVKHKNGMHAPVALQKLFDFEVSKLRFRIHI